jgi:hypothetical protein
MRTPFSYGKKPHAMGLLTKSPTESHIAMGLFEKPHSMALSDSPSFSCISSMLFPKYLCQRSIATAEQQQEQEAHSYLLLLFFTTMAPRKKRPGVGAKASLLTRFVHPKQNNPDKSHRLDVILISREALLVNRKEQVCFTFILNRVCCHAVQSHFRLEEEGKRGDLFDPPERERMKLKASRNQRSNGVKAKLRKISVILS